MKTSSSRFCFHILFALSTLVLAGCGGGSSSTTTPGGTTPPPTPTPSFQLAVTAPPSGAGTITSSPAGINCPGTCSATFNKGTQVTLTATANANYYFEGWGGACSGMSCTLTVTAAENVTASFAVGGALTVALAGPGTGTVTSTPAGINCPTKCTAGFAPNTSVTLTASPATNNSFASWSTCTGTGTCNITVGSASSVTATFGETLQSLNHIVILAQENRSLDDYFGYLRQYWALKGIPDQQFDGLPQFNQPGGINPPPGPIPTVVGCDPTNPNGANVCTPDPSVLVPSFHIQSVCTEELSPFWNEAHTDWNYSDPTGSTGAVNGWVISAANDARQYTAGHVNDLNGYRSMGYFQDSELPYYYYMASTFAISDRWFAPVMSRTQMNRMFLMAGTSAGRAYPPGQGNGPNGPLSNTTIFEALQNAGITWKIYVNSAGTNCADTDSACLARFSYINMFTYYSQITNSPALLQNIQSVNQFKADVAANTLPQVALIEPASNSGQDEHPTDVDSEGGVDVQAGAAYVEGLISALMYSPSWSSSAFILTYDEDGGFYDHVPPQSAAVPDTFTYPNDLKPSDICDGVQTPTCSFGITGYRVPFILVSPFARKNYVSHTVYDHTAILKLIETRFGLNPLTNRDASQADMSTDFFDFVNVPWATPPASNLIPQQTTNSPCDLSAPTP